MIFRFMNSQNAKRSRGPEETIFVDLNQEKDDPFGFSQTMRDRDPRTNFSVREGTLRMVHFYFQAQEDDINSKKTTRRPSVRSRRSTVHGKKESILLRFC